MNRDSEQTDRLALIVPALDEADNIPALAANLQAALRPGHELWLVDGGSRDGTAELASKHGFRVLSSPPGRAAQMNAGAAASSRPLLLFLHADTRLPEGADALIEQALRSGARHWGRFDVTITGASPVLRLVGTLMNSRSRLTGIATGDQALFMTRRAFDAVGGFPDQPLMEDIEISRRLKRLSPPRCLRARVTTSGRRWDQRGVWRTITLMWRLRLAYWRGVPAKTLARHYR
ncbi:rSAM/selenodomain-associated transferase 2 [Alkalispirillum mobile]|uniref:RSAM/selenodomain-associated transferase 2 n=1 Tax=Alkalispirillum mobile TaxID=85925 RepID=A0A498CCI6_9GAMM|nr:TIGR04283 family arsenosugar biosynthesis glycosyltransferase [Alkalispirillum mobile]RLK50960.1 rSAM/selenodomain-associated transferase 2 [Alkalispirillum mobile]